MKTITDLNNKLWYRLIKVIFILIIATSAIIAIVVNFGEVGNYQNDYSVSCNYGNKSTFLAYKDKEIYIPGYEDYTESLAKLPDSTKDQLKTACAISKEDISALLDSYMNGTNNGTKLYDLTKTKIITDTYVTATLWSLLSLVIIFVISEIIKRAFYYVILGSIRPKS